MVDQTQQRDLHPELPDPAQWTLVDPRKVTEKLEGGHENRQLKKYLESLRKYAKRTIPSVTHEMVNNVRALKQDFPNFGEVIDSLCNSLHGSALLGDPLKLRPTCYYGPPGVGKSAFGERLASALELDFHRISLPDITASMVLTGSSIQWSNGSPGLIAQKLLSDKPPLICFDELDKTNGSSDFRVEPVLLSLLEPGTVTSFTDEYIGLPMDLSPVSFIFTANDDKHLLPALRSRLDEFQIGMPGPEQMPAIVRSVDRVVRRSCRKYSELMSELDESLVNAFPVCAPREIHRALQEAYDMQLSTVMTMQKVSLQRDVLIQQINRIKSRTAPVRRSIGFLAHYAES